MFEQLLIQKEQNAGSNAGDFQLIHENPKLRRNNTS
jgi:hypothetical protein